MLSSTGGSNGSISVGTSANRDSECAVTCLAINPKRGGLNFKIVNRLDGVS